MYDRKNFQDGNFEKFPNPCKSVASTSELHLTPFLACFIVENMFKPFNRAILSNIGPVTYEDHLKKKTKIFGGPYLESETMKNLHIVPDISPYHGYSIAEATMLVL